MAGDHSLQDHLDALDVALVELQCALDSGNGSMIFLRLGSVLHWMYAASELKPDRPGEGALGGLRWVRAQATHIGAAVREERLTKAHTYVRQDDAFDLFDRRLRKAGEWLPVAVHVNRTVWRNLGGAGRGRKRGARLYKEHVANRDLMIPLEIARRQLAEPIMES